MADADDARDLRKLIGINQATKEELEELPRVGPAMSERIMELRPFESWESVSKVKGIGAVLLGILKAQIFLNFPPKSYLGPYDKVEFDNCAPSTESHNGIKTGAKCILKKTILPVTVTKPLKGGYYEVRFDNGQTEAYHHCDIKAKKRLKPESEETEHSQWRDFMFEQHLWGEDAAQMWEDLDENVFEGSTEPGEAMEEDSEESIEAKRSKMDYAYVQVSKNNRDMQVRPYQLSCLPNPKRFPHIGRVNVTIDWLQILGLPLKKTVGINQIDFDAAWPGMLGDDRSGTGALINGAPGLYQWVMTSAHIVFPAQRISHFEKCVEEIKGTEKKIRKELETDDPKTRTTIIKSTLLEAIVDVLARLAEFRENLKEIRGDWFKIPNCPMKVSFAHQCHGNLNRTTQPVKTWKIYDTFEGRWGLGDDYQSDEVGAIKRYRGQDIAVMKLERPLQLTEAPFSLITLEGSEEDIQQTLPPVEIWGYVCDKKGHVVEHSDGRRLKYPSSNTFIRGHASQCTQTQHRFPRNSLDVRPHSPYILQVRGEFNVGHSGAVGFVECGDKKFGVGVLSGPNLSRDKYNGDPYVDSVLTGFSAPVVDWLQESLPKSAMPPQQRFHVSDFSAYIKENSSKPAEECSQQNIARSKEDDLWETTRLKNVTLRKRKKSISPTPALEWNGKSSGTPTPGMKRKLEVADFRPPKKTKLNQEEVSA